VGRRERVERGGVGDWGAVLQELVVVYRCEDRGDSECEEEGKGVAAVAVMRGGKRELRCVGANMFVGVTGVGQRVRFLVGGNGS